MKTYHKPHYIRGFAILVCLVLLLAPIGAAAGKQGADPWWIVVPEDETPSTYYDSLLYSDIAPRLHEIQESSNRVKVEVIGQSAGGRDMYLVTLSDPKAMGRLGSYQAIRKLMLTDPERAQEMIDLLGDFKVPVFINGSIHGTEYPGVDAAMRLIETLAFGDTPEVQAILENTILLVNVVANPDGRVLGTRYNATGIDLNRDFITQSQPETRAMAEVISEWNPMVLLDLHGFMTPMLIEPCTPPHNPNYEYDLYIRWAYAEALAMEAELYANTGFLAQIPIRDDPMNWDDWPPTYTPMYAMYHGAYGHTLETPYQDERGVEAHYWAVWGALKFITQNKADMIHDQIEIFRRGFLDLPQLPISDDILDELKFDQYTELMLAEFPTAYLLPPDVPFQQSDHQVARLVDFLLFNDTQVEQAVADFTYGGVTYPAGTYVVWMDQPKRGLANTILEDGHDLSFVEGLSFYSPPSVWSHPHLWGVDAVRVEDALAVQTVAIQAADPPQGSLSSSLAQMYAFQPTSLAAYQAVNALLEREAAVYRLDEAYAEGSLSLPASTFLIPGDPALATELVTGWALDLVVLDSSPAALTLLHKPAVAVSGDSGVRVALDRLGFDVTFVSSYDLNQGALAEYDLFINAGTSWSSLNVKGKAYFQSWLANGGDYLGLGRSGASLATQSGSIAASYSLADANAIVRVDYTPGGLLSAGFPAQGSAFVYYPVWFSDLGSDVVVAGSYASGAFLISGYWPDWPDSGAAGAPVIIHRTSGESLITLVGLDITFRGHPEDTFRLLGSAIFASQ